MAITIRKYVDITSGVGAGNAVARRDFMLRIYTDNILLPVQSLAEFTDLESVGNYFGTTSEEYARASLYFGWISKNITRANRIAFARWNEAATAARIFGTTAQKVLSTFTAITSGTLYLTIGADSHQVTGINLSTATSLANVASLLQTAIRAQSGAQFTGATVTFDAVRNSFNLVSGTTGAAQLIVSPATSGTDLAAPLGWNAPGTILSDGGAAETISDVLTASTNASNNFGSFLFMPALTLDEHEQATSWNNAQNVMYMYLVAIPIASASTYYGRLNGYAGTALTINEETGEYAEQAPGMILAATRYSDVNSTQNYMFQVFNLTPSVTETTLSNSLDALRTNYYGQTQTAGRFLQFYQRGVLTGPGSAPVDMNTYANEMWFKDEVQARIMELFLNLPRLSANKKGTIQLDGQLQGAIDMALNNGTISVDKPLTDIQKVYIGEVSNDPDAWRQVQNSGYWKNIRLESYVTEDNRTEWKAVYVVVYSKDDQIRKVEGTHTLI